MSADRERASPDSSKINPNPSLLQRHIGSEEEHETTPSRNLNVSTARAEGVQRRETSRNSPQRLNHTSALAGSESTAERILDRAHVRAGFERRPTAKRMARKADLSAFFQPWWYAEPARERRRNPG